MTGRILGSGLTEDLGLTQETGELDGDIQET